MSEKVDQKSRREFVKKIGYAAPVILTMKAVPAFAKNGSPLALKGNNGIGQEKRGIIDGPPPGLAKQPDLDFNDKDTPLGGGRPK